MLSSLKDISGSPSFQGGSAAPAVSSNSLGTVAAGGGDIATGGGSVGFKIPQFFWVGVALLGAVVIYKMVKKK